MFAKCLQRDNITSRFSNRGSNIHAAHTREGSEAGAMKPSPALLYLEFLPPITLTAGVNRSVTKDWSLVTRWERGCAVVNTGEIQQPSNTNILSGASNPQTKVTNFGEVIYSTWQAPIVQYYQMY